MESDCQVYAVYIIRDYCRTEQTCSQHVKAKIQRSCNGSFHQFPFTACASISTYHKVSMSLNLHHLFRFFNPLTNDGQRRSRRSFVLLSLETKLLRHSHHDSNPKRKVHQGTGPSSDISHRIMRPLLAYWRCVWLFHELCIEGSG